MNDTIDTLKKGNQKWPPFKFIYCKLISRILSPLDNGGYHLSGCCITATILAAYPSASGEQPSNADIRGIAVHKVYPPDMLPNRDVSFYLTFSPLSRSFGLGRLFSVALSFHIQ